MLRNSSRTFPQSTRQTNCALCTTMHFLVSMFLYLYCIYTRWETLQVSNPNQKVYSAQEPLPLGAELLNPKRKALNQ